MQYYKGDIHKLNMCQIFGIFSKFGHYYCTHFVEQNWMTANLFSRLFVCTISICKVIIHSWGFLGWATTWGNGRVSQSFWVLENNSVVLKSLFCGIVWCEIQSFRKATCNFVVLTFIEKKTSSTRDRTRDPQIRSQLLYQMSYWGFVVKV